MLLLATMMLGMWVFISALGSNDADDDDDFDGGMMIPAYNPTSCLLYTSPSPRDRQKSRMPSSA